MAKKSSQKRQNQSARGAANRAPASAPTLVRQSRLDAADAETSTSANTTARPAAASVVRDAAAPKQTPRPALKPTAPIVPPARPAAAAKAPAATTGKRQNTRVARANATQRARQAGLISAENYGYVLQDLKLVAVLAACAVLALVVLTFTLPH